MLRNVGSLNGFSIGAMDGEIGRVVDFYFDDQNWTIRYLVADTGTWLTGRKVLISPASFRAVDWDSGKIDVSLTQHQVENAPEINTDRPVSRQHEISYYNYFHYPYYWTGPGLWGPAAFPHGLVATGAEAEIASAPEEKDSQDVHLRSVNEVAGYYIEAEDGNLGHVDDFIVDDESWTIRYMVIDTRNWWPGKKVLISPQWVSDVVLSESRVYVDLPREQIKASPEYDGSPLISREYESRLYGHYQRSGYWID